MGAGYFEHPAISLQLVFVNIWALGLSSLLVHSQIPPNEGHWKKKGMCVSEIKRERNLPIFMVASLEGSTRQSKWALSFSRHSTSFKWEMNTGESNTRSASSFLASLGFSRSSIRGSASGRRDLFNSQWRSEWNSGIELEVKRTFHDLTILFSKIGIFHT